MQECVELNAVLLQLAWRAARHLRRVRDAQPLVQVRPWRPPVYDYVSFAQMISFLLTTCCYITMSCVLYYQNILL